MPKPKRNRRSDLSVRSLCLEVLEDRCLLSYTLTDLTPILFRAGGINNLGQVAGTVRGDDGLFHAVVWEPAAGIVRDLGEGGAEAINDAGQVAGETHIDGVPQNVVWDSDGVITGEFSMFISAINNAGQVAGSIPIGMGFYHAALWDPAIGVQDLGSLGGRGEGDASDAINDAGVVVGGSYNAAGYQHAFVWDGCNGMQDLTPDATESFAAGINNAGQIVGNADGTAFLAEGGALTPLGQWVPQAINNVGQIVGWAVPQGAVHGVIYADGVLRDLNSLIQGSTGLTIFMAFEINDAGWIRATALDAQSHFHSVLLTPDDGAGAGSTIRGAFPVLVSVPETAHFGLSTEQPPARGLREPAPVETAAATVENVAPALAGATPRLATHDYFASGHRVHTVAEGGAWQVDGLDVELTPLPSGAYLFLSLEV
jgi:probable HAF family extracellular repeat protein